MADVLKSVCERIRGIVPGGNAPIVRGSASEWAARSAVCLSFILLAFFQTVSVSVLTVFLTVLLSFCVILFTVRRTDTLALFRAKPVRSLAVLGFSVIVCLAAHDSVGVFRSEQWRQTSAYARIPLDPYAAGFFLFASLSLAFLVLKLLDVSRLPDRIRAFFAALGRRSILWYALFSLAVLAGLCVLYIRNPGWYYQYDNAYSMDSRWCFKDIFPNLLYADIRHPLLGTLGFPFWALGHTLAGLFPEELSQPLTAAFIQFCNVQLLLAAGVLLAKMARRRDLFLLYVCSSSAVIFAVCLEKYPACMFFLVLYTWALTRSRDSSGLFYVLATGMMPTSCFIGAAGIPGHSLKENLRRIARAVISGVAVLACTGKIYWLDLPATLEKARGMHETFGSGDLNFTERLIATVNMYHSVFFPMASASDGKHFVWTALNEKLSLLGLAVIVLITVGVIFNRKSRFVRICAFWAAVPFPLFILLNWAPWETPLFNLYFSWAIIPPAYLGLEKILCLLRVPRNMRTVLAAVLCAGMLVGTVLLLCDMNGFLLPLYQ